MPNLPDKLNPLSKAAIYDELKIDSTTSTEDLKKVLENFSVESLKTKRSDAEIDEIRKSIALLKHNFTRVTLNALILEKVELKTVAEHLKQLPNLKKGNIRLPKPDLSQVHIEGQSIEISERDLKPVDKDSSFELNFSEVKDHLKPKGIDKHHYFDT